MLVRFSNFFRSVELSLDEETVRRFDNTKDLCDILQENELTAVRKTFPNTPLQDIMAFRAEPEGGRMPELLWCYHPSALVTDIKKAKRKRYSES